MNNNSKKVILLVEDEVVIAIDEAETIGSFGYKVITVNSGEEAVETISSGTEINLILMDIDLGKGINGPEAAEKILSLRTIPIVFLTSHSEMEYVEKVKKITRYGYVLKNSGDFVLRSSIEMAFELFNSHRQNLENTNSLNRIFNMASDMISIADLTTMSFVRVNPAFTKILGYNEEELLGHPFLNFVHPDDIQSTRDSLESSQQKDKEIVSFINRYCCKDGSYRYINWNSHPIIAEGLTYAIAHDITEQKKTMEALQQSKNFNETIINASPDVIVVYDINEAKVVYTNNNIVNILDYSPGEMNIMGNNIIQILMHPDDYRNYITSIMQAYKSLPDNEFIEHEYRLKHKDGHWVWLLSKGSIFLRNEDGSPKQIFGIIRDISEYIETRKALEQSESFIRTVMDNLPIGVAVNSVDPAVKFNYMNDNFPSFYRTCREALADPDSFWEAVYEDPEFRRKIRKRVINDYLSGEPSRMHWKDVPITRKGKETKYITAMNIPIPEKKLTLSTVWDVTDRKHAEEKTMSLLREKEVLLKEVHHRVKNNIRSIKALLSLQVNSSKYPELTVSLKDTIGRLESMEIMYDKLYRTENYRNVSTREYLSQLVDSIYHTFNEKHFITIKQHIDDLKLNPEILFPLGIIINELLTNAIKHAFTDRNNGEIFISIIKNSHTIMLIFKDNGIGMTHEDVEIEKGFGLTLINSLVEQLQGNYRIESNQGTKFVIEFEQ